MCSFVFVLVFVLVLFNICVCPSMLVFCFFSFLFMLLLFFFSVWFVFFVLRRGADDSQQLRAPRLLLTVMLMVTLHRRDSFPPGYPPAITSRTGGTTAAAIRDGILRELLQRPSRAAAKGPLIGPPSVCLVHSCVFVFVFRFVVALIRTSDQAVWGSDIPVRSWLRAGSRLLSLRLARFFHVRCSAFRPL